MQYLLGCLGIIIILGIIMTVLGWMFTNIVGVLGIAFAIWGIYECNINRKLGAKSKAPGIIVATGVFVASIWFIGSESVKAPATATPSKSTETSATNTAPTSKAETVQYAAKNTTPAQTNASDTGITNSTQVATKTQSTAVAGAALISAKVIEVIDGDTIKVSINGKEETVRMLLVDTPETKHPTYGLQPFGKEASNFTMQLLNGKTVELAQDVNDGPDKYGRLLYYVYVEGKSVQEQLLEKGLARVAYVYVPNVKYVDKYRDIQSKAQKAGVGIWSIENYAQEDGYHSELVKKNGQGADHKVVSAKTTPQQPKPQPSPKPKQSNLPYDPFGPDRDCGDFSSQEEAQRFFEAAGGPARDPHRLDRDKDGLACEKN